MTPAVESDADPSGPSPGEPGPEPEITEDELFDVLSNRRRRYAVHTLEREGEPLQLGPLAE